MAKRRFGLVPWLKVGVWVGGLVPLGLLAKDFVTGAYLFTDPIELIQRTTGISVLILLFVTLAITPLRRLTGWNRLIRFRRLTGLFAFFYAVLHAFSYFVFDQRLSLSGILDDVAEHPWVLVGFTAFLLLIPLAVTSTTGWIRRMGGKRWTRLHMLIYPTAVLGVLHFLWLVKADENEPVVYAVVLGVLLGIRAWIGYSARRSKRPSGAGRTSSKMSASGDGPTAATRRPASKQVTLPS